MMNPLKWYKNSLETVGFTQIDKVVLIICLSVGAVCCLLGAGLFLFILPKIISGALFNRLMPSPQAIIFYIGLILFLIFTAVLCIYTVYLAAKKEVMQ